MSNISPLFTTPILHKPLNLNLAAIKHHCQGLRIHGKGREVSIIGGWQSEDLVGEHPELNDLFLEIELAGNEFTNYINNDWCKLDNVWVNFNSYRDYNRPHVHSKAYVSGVYYVQTPENCGNLCFEHPSPLHNTEWDHVPNVMGYIPQENNLYLFPNWLSHYVLPNLNEKEERISISFNLKLDKSPEL